MTTTPHSYAQCLQFGELAESLNTASELVVVRVPARVLCVKWTGVIERQQLEAYTPKTPTFTTKNNEEKQQTGLVGASDLYTHNTHSPARRRTDV